MNATEPVLADGMHNFAGAVASNLVSQRRFPHQGCALPFRQMTLRPDGSLGLCCVDMAGQFTLPVDSKESIVTRFHHDPTLNAVRDALNRGQRTPSPCVQCSYSGLDYLDG